MGKDDKRSVLEHLNKISRNTLMETLEIVYSDVGEGFLEAHMPVSPRVHQPMGLLHGGATAALAESVGSAASALNLNRKTHGAVGMELSVNHLRSLREGRVVARAEAVHLGRSTHLWDISIRDQDGQLVAVSRLRMMVIEKTGA
jgi:1,4-dihydroxy-2-naphthoyl-CoA hydrolase